MATKQLTHTAAQVDDAAEKRHQHQNMSVLNAITASKTQAWDGKQDKIEAGTGISIAADGKTISATGGLALGETATTAYRGDRGKTAYEHTSSTNNPHGVTKAQVGLGNVDNTSDQNKPVSIATQEALDEKQDKLIAGSGIVIAPDGKTISSTGGGGTGGTNWGEIGGNIQSQSDLVSALAGKANSVHSHAVSDVTNLQTALDGKQAKQTFTANTSTPSDGDFVLMQASSETGTTAILKRAISKVWDYIKGKADLVYATISHSHVISDVTDLQTALNGKASSTHTHIISDVTSLQTALDGKAPSAHTHTISEITSLQSALGGKFEETESDGSGIAPYLCEIKATISGGSLSFASDQVENLREMFASMYSENKARHICVLTITGGSTTPLTLCTVDLRSYSSTGGSAKFVNTTDYTEILITYANNAVTSTIDKLFWVGTTTQYNALSSDAKNSGKPFFTTD